MSNKDKTTEKTPKLSREMQNDPVISYLVDYIKPLTQKNYLSLGYPGMEMSADETMPLSLTRSPRQAHKLKGEADKRKMKSSAHRTVHAKGTC